MDLIPVMRPWLGDEEVAAAGAVLSSGWIAQGPRVAEFEHRLADRVGAKRGVAVSSCTAGLHLALHSLAIGPGDEVITPSLSFIASANAPRYVGATPVFADVDETTMNVTVDTIEQVATQETRAVIAVHQVGMPADLEPITEYCAERNISVIEDAACAIGSTYRGAPIGGHSDYVTFSFHPRKLVTTGEGGMVMMNDEAVAERLAALRQHGMSVSAYDRHTASGVVIEKYPEMGFNFRMTDIQAAIGITQLEKLDQMVRRRRELADEYRTRLHDVPGFRLPQDPPYGTTNYQSFVVVVEDDHPSTRDELMGRMINEGISVRRGVMAAHRETAFSGHPHVSLPATEHLADRGLILPMYHEMTEDHLDRIATSVRRAAHVG